MKYELDKHRPSANGEPKFDPNACWSDATISEALRRRNETDGTMKRYVELREALDKLEDDNDMSSAHAAVRLPSDALWPRLYAEYKTLIRAGL